MLGAVSASLLWDLAKRGGAMEQLELLDTVPFIEINLKYFTDEYINYRWHGADGTGVTYSCDSACFSEVRRLLGKRGYLYLEENWKNGDRVLRPFYLNRMLFDVGDKFVCAAAHHYTMKRWMESEEYKRRDPDYFIYGGSYE